MKTRTAILLSFFFAGQVQAQKTVKKTPKIKTIELSTGAALQYAEQGNPLGIPVLLLHIIPK
ncbi:MAG TPA: hypothetical protein VFM65_02230 [Flavobacteriaceae bacterium]|nr:hypothetical protein [Flavobacteriaceae bacterium]